MVAFISNCFLFIAEYYSIASQFISLVSWTMSSFFVLFCFMNKTTMSNKKIGFYFAGKQNTSFSLFVSRHSQYPFIIKYFHKSPVPILCLPSNNNGWILSAAHVSSFLYWILFLDLHKDYDPPIYPTLSYIMKFFSTGTFLSESKYSIPSPILNKILIIHVIFHLLIWLSL